MAKQLEGERRKKAFQAIFLMLGKPPKEPSGIKVKKLKRQPAKELVPAERKTDGDDGHGS